MRYSILIVCTLLAACTTTPSGLDDEAGVTTAMGESSTGTSSETTEESGGTTTATTTFGMDGTVFFPVSDVTPLVECDSFAQDCPPGEKCVPYSIDDSSWNASKCVPVTGDQQPGESCNYGGLFEATDDCDASSICWDVIEVEGQLVGTCVEICTGSPDDPMCPAGSSCAFASDGVVFVCIPTCNPVVQDCGPGLACYWVGSEFSCIFVTQDIPTGEPCRFINDCAQGNLCADASSLPSCAGASCCTGFCDLQLGDADCAAQPGTACVTFFELGMAPPGLENVGICVLPP